MSPSLRTVAGLAVLAASLLPGCDSSSYYRHRLEVVAPRPLSSDEAARLVPLGGRLQGRAVRHWVLLFVPLPFGPAPEVEALVAEVVASRAGVDALLDAEITFGEDWHGWLVFLYHAEWVEVTGTPAAIRPPEGSE